MTTPTTCAYCGCETPGTVWCAACLAHDARPLWVREGDVREAERDAEREWNDSQPREH